jgi:hypothetical protein
MPKEYTKQPHDIALTLIERHSNAPEPTWPERLAIAQVYALLAINDRLASIEATLNANVNTTSH